MKWRKRKDTNNSQKFDEISGILAQEIYSFHRMDKKGMKSSISLACADKVLKNWKFRQVEKRKKKRRRKKEKRIVTAPAFALSDNQRTLLSSIEMLS